MYNQACSLQWHAAARKQVLMVNSAEEKIINQLHIVKNRTNKEDNSNFAKILCLSGFSLNGEPKSSNAKNNTIINKAT